jgi:hypothetical protein
MIQQRLTIRTLWPLLLIGVPLAVGLGLGACGQSNPAATPTPTKTPRPADTSVVPTAQPVAVAEAAEDAGGQPRAISADATIEVPTNTPLPTATVSPTPMPPTSTPRASVPTAVPGMGHGMTSPDYGIQAFLWWRPEVADRDLELIKDAGFRWVKQYFSWQDIEGGGKGQFDWSQADRVVEEAEKYGLKLIVRVSQDPDRPFWAGQPPENTGHFADFLAAMASRYRGRIQAYQIWNEPNLAREWGGKHPDPAAYARMLQVAYGTIKSIDPNAIIVTAGMAPTTQDDQVAMPDLRFYQGMYDAMGGKSSGYFDMLGVHGAGYAVAPETDPQVVVDDPKLHNNDPSPPELLRVYAFRHIEDVRDLMVRNGDANKRVVVLEFGWTSDPREDSPYYWHGKGAGIGESLKGDYLVRAYQWAAQHWQPWIALMTAIYMPDVDWTKDDEQYWWSVLGPGYPDLYLRPAYVKLCAYIDGLTGQVCKHAPP